MRRARPASPTSPDMLNASHNSWNVNVEISDRSGAMESKDALPVSMPSTDQAYPQQHEPSFLLKHPIEKQSLKLWTAPCALPTRPSNKSASRGRHVRKLEPATLLQSMKYSNAIFDFFGFGPPEERHKETDESEELGPVAQPRRCCCGADACGLHHRRRRCLGASWRLSRA